MFSFFTSGSVIIHTKNYRKVSLEERITALENIYGTTFKIKDATHLNKAGRDCESTSPEASVQCSNTRTADESQENNISGEETVKENKCQTNNENESTNQSDSNPQLASLAKWLSVRLRTKWLWVRVQLQSLKLQISRLFRARSSLTFRQL